MSIFDPLEQFSIEVSFSYFQYILKILLGNSNYFINMPLCKMIFFNFFLVVFFIYNMNAVFVKNKFQKLILWFFSFVINIVQDAISVKKYSFILLFYIIFLFLFLSNILGMVPFSMTITSHLILTLYFSLGFFIGNNLIGIFYHKQNFFVLFLPEGVPIFIIPLLILIEYVSYISRIFSLAIRLFANMLSGHILLKILICFIWAIAISNVIHWFWILLPLSIVFAVIGLETAIAFLQAYVFLVLVSIYFNDVINTH